MTEYMYNEFIEDIMLDAYENMFDMTCIYDRETYNYIYSLLEYYYNNIVIAKMNHNNLKRKCHDSIENIHRIISYSSRIDAIEFMLLCNCINQINEYFQIDVIIDFDDYIDIDNTCMIFYRKDSLKRFRKRHAYYDYEYCNINITAYIAQYMQIYS